MNATMRPYENIDQDPGVTVLGTRPQLKERRWDRFTELTQEDYTRRTELAQQDYRKKLGQYADTHRFGSQEHGVRGERERSPAVKKRAAS